MSAGSGRSSASVIRSGKAPGGPARPKPSVTTAQTGGTKPVAAATPRMPRASFPHLRSAAISWTSPWSAWPRDSTGHGSPASRDGGETRRRPATQATGPRAHHARERHQRNPRVALPVTSLEGLSGNPELAHLFVRLTPEANCSSSKTTRTAVTSTSTSASRARSRRCTPARRTRENCRRDRVTCIPSAARTIPLRAPKREVLAACVVDDEGERMLFDP